MTCQQCHNHFEEKYARYFVNGICLTCQSINDLEYLHRRWDAELIIYTHRSGFVMDIGEFYYNCLQGSVDRLHLAGLPELFKAYDEAQKELKYCTAEETKQHAYNTQMKLF